MKHCTQLFWKNIPEITIIIIIKYSSDLIKPGKMSIVVLNSKGLLMIYIPQG